jgi:sortase A
MKKIKTIIKIFLVIFIVCSGVTATYVGLHYRDVSNWITRIAAKDANGHEHRLKIKKNKVSKNIAHKLAYGDASKDDLTSPLKIWQYAHDTSYPLGYVGRVAIPSRNINLPINNGSTNRVLAVGAGTLKDSFAPSPFNEADIMGKSNFAICGHNMDDHYTLFSAVPDMVNGESIYTYDGHRIYKYRKYLTRQISPLDIAVIFNNKETDLHPQITITTCTFDGTARFMVKGKLVQNYTKKNAPKNVKRLFFYKK